MMTQQSIPVRPKFIRNDDIGLAVINRDVDTTVDRIFIKRIDLGSIEISYFASRQKPNAYESWINIPMGIHAALKKAGDVTPLFHHDFVDSRL